MKKFSVKQLSIALSLGFATMVIALFFFVRATKEINSSIGDYKRYLIIGKENLIAVYEDKLAVKIPFEIQADKEETFGMLVEEKKYDEILEIVNKIFPEKIDIYRVVKFGNVDLQVKNALNIPQTNIENKSYVITSSVNSMFKTYYSNEENKSIGFENTIIDILNANGTAGYAKLVGDKLQKELGIKTYNSSNNDTNLEESAIIVNDISRENAQKIILKLNEKYVKIKSSSELPTLANAVLILGKEGVVSVKIELIGAPSETAKINKKLSDLGYKNISNKSSADVNETPVIEYAEEDYYIAYKIGEKLGIKDLVQNNENVNNIKIKL